MLFTKSHGLVSFNRAKVPQVRLVSNEHNDDVGLGVITELLEPALNIFKGTVFGDIVYQESSHRTSEFD
eukprot:7872493-Ditylum_brightwellii.AAC.1